MSHSPTLARQVGRRPWGTPTLHLTADFIRAARTRPLWMVASWGSFPDFTKLSRHLCAGTIKGTPLMMNRMWLIADALDFPRERVFVQGPKDQAS